MNDSNNPKQRTLVIGLILLGLIIVGFFGLRTIRAFRKFDGHRPPPPFAQEQVETDVSLIRDWMTIPFIANMYHVPPPVLFKALDIPQHKNKNMEKSLKQLNDEYYPEVEGVVLEKSSRDPVINQRRLRLLLPRLPRPTSTWPIFYLH
jgi:hypothetical protein